MFIQQHQSEYLVLHISVTLSCAKCLSDAVCAKKAMRRRLILCMTTNLLLHVSIIELSQLIVMGHKLELYLVVLNVRIRKRVSPFSFS